MLTNRTRGVRGDSKLPRTLRLSANATEASPRRRVRRQPRKKNTPCFLDLAGVKFLLKKERVFFFRGSALQVFGQGRNKMRCQKLGDLDIKHGRLFLF